MDHEPEIYFQEEQQMRQAWVWGLLLSTSAFILGTGVWAIASLAQGKPIGEPPLGAGTVLLLGGSAVLVDVALLWLLYFARMQTEVSSEGLFVKFWPFHRQPRKISLDGMRDYAIVDYNPLLEYGGWGIRKRGRATAYNMRGTRGVRIYYENGYHFLIGSQQAEALYAALQRVA